MACGWDASGDEVSPTLVDDGILLHTELEQLLVAPSRAVPGWVVGGRERRRQQHTDAGPRVFGLTAAQLPLKKGLDRNV